MTLCFNPNLFNYTTLDDVIVLQSKEKDVNDHAVKVVQQLCPSVRASYLSTAFSSNLNKNENLVLI